MMTLTVKLSDDIKLTIEDGDVCINGAQIGRLERRLKYGYRPIVVLVTDAPRMYEEFELDHPGGIVNAAVDRLRVALVGVSE